MKKIIVLFLIVCSTIILGYSQTTPPIKPLDNSVSIGLSYANFSGELGLLYSNQIKIGITKRLSISPEFYYAHTHYPYDSKNGSSQLAGINLSIYYAIVKSKSFKLELGGGYGFRHSESTWVRPALNFPGLVTQEQTISDIHNSHGLVFNINLEKTFHEKYFIGLQLGWQAYGQAESLWHIGLHTGVKF